MGKHSAEGEASRSGGKHGTYDGRHRAEENYSGFNVDSPEREARGIGNRQTGGRDD
jgi:hypothetical protein